VQGLNIRCDIYARDQQADDAVGGSVRADLLRYARVRARIANVSNPTVLSMQGFEGKDLHNIILYGDHYPAIEREDIIVPRSGRWTNARFKVVEVRFSSVLNGGQRAHIQLVAERLRYAHENIGTAVGAVAYSPAVTLDGAMLPGDTYFTYISVGDPIQVGDIMQIDDEAMVCSALNLGFNFASLIRGYAGTLPAAHSFGASILFRGNIT